MNAKRGLTVIAVSAFALAAMYWLALAPYAPQGSDTSLLRLSWRMRGEIEEECRERSEEELEKIPVHMRTARVCEREAVAYELKVSIDGRDVLALHLIAAGAKGDRPIYVLEEFPLEPGAHRIRVALEADHGDDDDDDDEDEKGEARTVLDEMVQFEKGRIHLVTLDATRTPRIAP
jgi:hypothetical protein